MLSLDFQTIFRDLMRQRLLVAGLVILCLAATALALYTFRLDVELRERFDGVRWALPAQIYAAPLELYAGKRLGPQDVVHELGRLGYRSRNNAQRAGTYSVQGDRIRVASRGFQFWDGAEPERLVDIRFGDGGIRSIQDAGGGSVPIMRLDPMLIGSIFPKHGEDRVLVRLDDVPPLLVNTLIAVEDGDFYRHYGIDWTGIARAAWANLQAGGVVQGGSTITQQLIKNFFLSSERTWVRKAKEALMAILLEVHYSKQEILEAYLNEVYLGQDGPRAVHGFGLASGFYFGKPLGELLPEEIALMVGLVKGPSYYNPRRNPERSLARRNLVLDRMEADGLISAEEAAAARAAKLGVRPRGDRGTSQYPAYVDLVRRQLQAQYREQDLTSEGLRIFTAFDPRVQAAAEQAVLAGLDAIEQGRGIEAGSLEAAAVVTSVETGEILALVGGRQAGYAGFNRALDAQRPIGSLAKPLVYLAALSRPDEYRLTTPVPDAPIRLDMPNGSTWMPENYDRELHGDVPLYEALSKSYNLATVQLALQVGMDDVARQYVLLGDDTKPAPLPSLALGAVERSPLAVAQLYNSLGAGGFVTPLQAIRDVQDREGQPLERFARRLRGGPDAGAVGLVQWAMNRVMIDGTARSAQRYLRSTTLAGKTGTTDELRDSWFAGFGGDVQATVWVGRDDNKPAQLTGASGALQLWSRIMAALDPRPVDLFATGQAEPVWVVPQQDALADTRCEDRLLVPYLPGSAPDAWASCAEQADSDAGFWERLFGP
ncbi:MAG: penicillin-binding protein 1B [Pseudomonadota bacterium]|nr:penicillin-binding protein 1B [Pseudomonadota bacterium]